MALEPLEIRITADGAAAKRGLKEVESKLQNVADSVRKGSVAMEQAGTATEKAGAKSSRALDAAKVSARGLKEESDKVSDSATRLNDRLSSVGSAAVGLGAAGVGALVLARSWSAAAAEGDGIVMRLKSILDAQKRLDDYKGMRKSIDDIVERGHMPDDDPAVEAVTQMASDQVATPDIAPLLEAAARNAEALKQPLDQIGTLFAKAYSEGSLERLQRANILFSEEEKAAVDAAYGISELAGRAEFMRVVLASTARGTGELGKGLSDATKSANDAARAMDDLQTSLGQGVAVGESNLRKVNARLLEMIHLSPEAAKGIGNISFWAGTAATSLGGLVVAGIGVVSGLGTIATSGTALTDMWNAVKAAGVSAWAQITASATATTVGLNLATAGVTALALGLGAAGAAGIYHLGQINGLLDQQKGFLDAVADGWNAVKDSVTGGNSAGFGVDARALKEELAKVDYDKAKSVNDGKKTQEQADKDATAAKVKIYDNFSRHAFEVGDKEGAVSSQEAGARLKGQAVALPTLVPALSPVSVAPTLPATPAPSVQSPVFGPPALATLKASNASDSQSRINAIEAEIDRLQSEKESATNRRKPVIQKQIVEAKRQLDAARDQLKLDEAAAKQGDQNARDSLTLRKIRIGNEVDSRVAALEDELESAKKDGDAERIRSLTLQIEISKAQATREVSLQEAALEADTQHRAALIAQANEIYKGAAVAADRTATRATRGVKIKSPGVGDFGGGFDAFLGGTALNPGGYGGGEVPQSVNESAAPSSRDSFAGMSSFVTSSADITAMLREPRRASVSRETSQGSGTSGSASRDSTATVQNEVEDGGGEWLVRFDTVRIPKTGGLGSMRGRIKRR